MNKDAKLLAEAYESVLKKLNEREECKYAAEGCDCHNCYECNQNSKKAKNKKSVNEAKKKKNKKPDADGDGVPDWADKYPGKDDNAIAGKKKVKESEELSQIYLSVLNERTEKVINKKLARDYYKALKAMRKCEHGSKEYETYKSQKEDILKIVNDHGKTVADLDALLTKKEKMEAAGEGGEDHQVTAKTCTTCGGDHSNAECPEEGGTGDMATNESYHSDPSEQNQSPEDFVHRTAQLERPENYMTILKHAGFQHTGARTGNKTGIHVYRNKNAEVTIRKDLTGKIEIEIDGQPFHGDIHDFGAEVERLK